MKIVPYKSIGALNFGMDLNDALSLLGESHRRRVNRRNETELEFETFIYRFAADVGLVECSGAWTDIVLNDITLPIGWLEGFIRENDPNAKESVGFLISPAFGISIDLEHSGYISVFALGRWDKFLS